MAKKHFRKLASNVYALRVKGASAAMVTFGEKDSAYSGKTSTGNEDDTYVPWGKKNDQLARMHKLATASPNTWPLIRARRNFLVGWGVYTHQGKIDRTGKTLYKEVYSKEFDTWRDQVNFDIEFITLALEYSFSGNGFVKLTLDTNKKLAAIEVISAFKVRIRKLKKKESKPSMFLINPNFGTSDFKDADTQKIPAYDPANPTKFPVSILHIKERIPGQDFYSFADWWSTEAWMTVANMIPEFHKNGLLNGYNIKYHISIPDDYFEKDNATQEEKDALKEEVLQQMGDTFAGIDNAEKVLFTFHKNETIGGKEYPGVRVTPIKNPMSDDAYTGLFNTANEVQSSGHSFIPVLSGVATGSKLGGSGKELEAAANYQQGFLTPADRLILLQLLYVAKQINGWNTKTRFDIRNISLYTYDVTPGGTTQNKKASPPTEEKEDADQ
ncbi:hypothetical protein BWI97_08700 [Siphonobacter sp. BAB-5405]|uniref:hypothetical protein n=1 Tax=Siphonobacter sp. BAB-5405 TaxID=1864825 RepID=UPI000C804684|nr:hypothetical protein [Siphonobacter sp. BAB-5405]PMD97678.1 hypothetical protein BWI97_08700 [Siphonobacter sp. BAB-5405]